MWGWFSFLKLGNNMIMLDFSRIILWDQIVQCCIVVCFIFIYYNFIACEVSLFRQRGKKIHKCLLGLCAAADVFMHHTGNPKSLSTDHTHTHSHTLTAAHFNENVDLRQLFTVRTDNYSVFFCLIAKNTET